MVILLSFVLVCLIISLIAQVVSYCRIASDPLLEYLATQTGNLQALASRIRYTLLLVVVDAGFLIYFW